MTVRQQRATPPKGAGGRVGASGLTLLELAFVVGLFAVIAIMVSSFANTWRQAWQAERLVVRLSAAVDQAHEALALFYVGEFCSFGTSSYRYMDSAGISFTGARLYSEVLQRHVDEAAWARLLQDLPGGDAPRDFFTGRIWRGDQVDGERLFRLGFTFPPILEVRWSGYDPDEFDVPGPTMATRVGAVWDDGTDEMFWQRNLDRLGTRREGRQHGFLKENSSVHHAEDTDRCFY